MCRYSTNTYKEHYACFNCRKTFKDVKNHNKKCPNCRLEMATMGLDFRAPKQRDKKAWKIIEELYNNNIIFHSCGCNGPGYRPRKKWSLLDFLKKTIKRSEGEVLVERYKK